MPLKQDQTFGITAIFLIPGAKSFETVDCVVRHPAMHKPDGGLVSGLNESRQIPCENNVCSDGTQFSFNHDYEMVPGKWTFEYVYNGKKMVSKTFTVYKE